MKGSLTVFCIVLWMLFPPVLQAQERMLQGKVVMVGEQDELNAAVGQDVMLVESGDTARTKQGGKFRIFLKDSFKSGAKITLAVDRKDWRIQYPLDGETRVPDHLEKELIEVRLLPVGSKKFWSADRFEKFVAGMAEKSREQVRPGGKPQEIEFGRYIKEWAVKYGFSVQQARDEINKWAAEAEQENDPYQLGLAAFAKKNFGEAGKQFKESGDNKVKASVEATAQGQRLMEEAIRDFRLSGDSMYNDYRFSDALASYRRAEQLVSREKEPRLWAGIRSDIGGANWQIGIRAEGKAIHEHLDAAVTAYLDALMVYTIELFPHEWAATQSSLGDVLQDQGSRRSGEAGTQLFAEAVRAYREALKVYTKEQLPQSWAMTQNNLGTVLTTQGSGTTGEVRTGLFTEAIQAYRGALTVYSKEQLPHQWAMIQNNLGNLLGKQGMHTIGEAGMQLLVAAIQAHREALTVRSKDQLPQQWAATQNNLGALIREQGIRTTGEAGTQLLVAAAQAYRYALMVHTKEQLPQQWAITQNNLGNVLREQGTRVNGEEGMRLLIEAAQACQAALTVRTKEQLPQDWATTQYNLGLVLREQGIRTTGEAATQLLAEAAKAYRLTLTVYSKELFPLYWAMTQYHLGLVLSEQGARTNGESGIPYLTEAIQANHAALTIYTEEQFPQQWAMTQHNLGMVFREQGIRTSSEDGTRLLAESIRAYRKALTVRTKERFPQDWVRTQTSLANVLQNLKDWRGAAEAYQNILAFDPSHNDKYVLSSAAYLYQDKLFGYPEAFALNQQWLERHPDDLTAQANFAEANFTTSRFAEAEMHIAALLANPKLDSSNGLGLRTLHVATLLAMKKPAAVSPALTALRDFIRNQPSNFDASWNFEGCKHFIVNEPSLANSRTWLLDLFSAVEEKDARKRLAALEKIQAPSYSEINP